MAAPLILGNPYDGSSGGFMTSADTNGVVSVSGTGATATLPTDPSNLASPGTPVTITSGNNTGLPNGSATGTSTAFSVSNAISSVETWIQTNMWWAVVIGLVILWWMFGKKIKL